MRFRRRLLITGAVLLVAAAVAAAVILRKHAPPEPARLLPSADGFAYANFSWLRTARLAGQISDVPRDPDYQKFVDETGFQFERDLQEAAFAIHYPDAAARDSFTSGLRFSEVFIGKIDGQRLSAYLRKLAKSVSDYNSIQIYEIPLEGRTVRAAILNADTVAASNHPDPNVIRGIIDRSRKLAFPFGGPALLRQHYKHVPLASVAWMITRAEAGSGSPWQLSDLLSAPAVIVTSIRYLGSLHIRADAFTASEEEAQRVTDRVTAYFDIFRSAETSLSVQGPDPDVKSLFESVKIQRHGNRAELTASVSSNLLRKAVNEAPAVFAQPDEAATHAEQRPQGMPAQGTQPKRKAGK